MTDSNRPNLFHYATSELSQDAFICWLAAWAKPEYRDTPQTLHRTAKNFLVSLIKKKQEFFDSKSIRTVDISRQKARIDVLIEINKDADDRLAILIEDKTHSDFRVGQQLYPEIVIEKHLYTSDQIVPIFFKTGYQSRFDNLGEFETYLRSDFLEVLRMSRDKGVNNAIYNDFLFHLEEMEANVRQFSNKDLTEWKDNDWRGFFMGLYPTLEPYGANWGHVNNQAGGFMGFWWYKLENFAATHGYKPYLQLEITYYNEGRATNNYLCFKIEVSEKSNRSQSWYNASERLSKASHQLGITLLPSRRALGYSMTVARWQDEYRVQKDGQLDLEATLNNLNKAQRIVDTAFNIT